MLLERLGFAPADIYDSPWRSPTGLGVNAVIESEPAQLKVRTGMRVDVRLERTYVERRGFPVEWRKDAFGVCQVGEFTMMGRQRRFDTAMVGVSRNDLTRYEQYAGDVGTMFFNDSVLALDFVENRVARADSVPATLPPGIVDLPLVPDAQDGVPFVASIDVEGMSASGTFLIDSSRSQSWLSIDYVRRAASDRLARTLEKRMEKAAKTERSITLPGGPSVEHELWVGSWIAADVGRWGVRCDGILGADFLRRWIPVFDFPAQRLRLVDYAMALPSFRRL